MDSQDHAQRAVALTAIKKKAEQLIGEKKEPFEVQAFIQGAKKELTDQLPNLPNHQRALTVAGMAQNTF